MIYRSSPAVVVFERPPPTFLTAVPVVWNAFQARETILLLIPNSGATLVTVTCSPHKPKVAGSIPVEVGRFSGYENRRHACHMIMWYIYVVGGFDPEADVAIRNVNRLAPGAISWEIAAALPSHLFGLAAVSCSE
ncbi:hypothetical protein TNCV_3360441 [Trichonephila clavipes]|nr:hypothetical protein TNCV_3360441 [Trichonephila clavipes]